MRIASVICLSSLIAACAGDSGDGFAPDPSPAPPPTEATIAVDPSITHQTIRGWEAAAQAGQDDPDFEQFRDELFDRAVNELGINRLRLQIRSGAENGIDWAEAFRSGQIDQQSWRCVRYATQNDNDDPLSINPAGFQFSELDSKVEEVVLPLAKLLEANGERLFINVIYVAFTGQICGDGEYHHQDPNEYAEFVLAVHLHLRNEYGIVPDTWEVILEPDVTDFWRGRQIGEAMVVAAQRLHANGFETPFVAPSNTDMGRAVTYFDDLVDVTGVPELLAEISYHRYRGVSEANLRALAERGATYETPTAMLEHIGSGHEDLHEDLSVANVSAWQQFALAFRTADNGAQYFVIESDGDGTPVIRMGSRTRFLAQYFRYIRSGAQRIEAVSRDGSLDPLAFVNPDGLYTVVIKAQGAREFTISGLPAGSYGIVHTTEDEDGVQQAAQTIGAEDLLTAGIPDQGVLTVYRLPNI